MRSSGSFLASARLIAALTLGSRILGLIRERAFSHYFGTGELLSAFRIAFMLPNLARRLFGEGALSSAMIPVLAESLRDQGEKAARQFVGTLLKRLAIVLTVIVLAVEAAVWLARAYRDDLALRLAAILMPYMGLICVVAVLGGVLQVRRRFAVPAAAPMLLNAILILAVVGGASWAGLQGVELMYVLCGGVLIAGVTQLLACGAALRMAAFFPSFRGRGPDEGVGRVTRLMAPMVVGLSALQINSLMDHLIAYVFIQDNGARVGPAVLAYAQYLYQLPLGIFGIAFATAIYPSLTERAAAADPVGFSRLLTRGLRLSLFVAMPATVGLLFVARPLVATLLETGAFTSSSTERVSSTLFFYSLGLVAYFTQHLLVRAFYAVKDSRTPARVSMTMVAINLAMNLTLVFFMQERGLALATAVCAMIQVCWLGRLLAEKLPDLRFRLLLAPIGRSVIATAIMALALGLSSWLLCSGDAVSRSASVKLVTMVTVGVVTYVMVARMLRIEELGMLVRAKANDNPMDPFDGS